MRKSTMSRVILLCVDYFTLKSEICQECNRYFIVFAHLGYLFHGFRTLFGIALAIYRNAI